MIIIPHPYMPCQHPLLHMRHHVNIPKCTMPRHPPLNVWPQTALAAGYLTPYLTPQAALAAADLPQEDMVVLLAVINREMTCVHLVVRG